MPVDPQPPGYRPETKILSLGPELYDPVEAATFPKHVLRFRNDRAAAPVGLDGLSDARWIDHFGRFEPLPGGLTQPLALRYHGHQFRQYNPDLGDGRGFLFAQLRDDRGRLLDLGTKGSGRTPWSRFGDGRLTLKGGVREVLATEMLEALGVETSRSFSLIETGEALHRGDEPSPTRSAVLVRLSHGHIRIGSFQRLAWLDQPEAMRRLVDYVLRELYEEAPGDEPARRLLALVAERAARLAASYMAAGFVHGVLNSDNINITGESFDYGPWRFAPIWDAGFTAAYFDHTGLYGFGRQPQAIHWDVAQLALALRAVSPPEPLAEALDLFPAHYERALTSAMLARLAVRSGGERADLALLDALNATLGAGYVGFDRFFFDWRGGGRRETNSVDALYATPPFTALAELLARYEPINGALDHPYWSDSGPCTMLIDEVEAIWAPIAEADDWSRFEAKLAAVRRMGEAMATSDSSAQR